MTVVALLALALSQLPPLHVLLRPGRCEVEAFDRIQVTHDIGRPGAVWHLIVRNAGGRDITIRSLSLDFKPEDREGFKLQGRGYYQSSADQNAVILTSFKLPSGADWKHIVTFFAPPSRTEERELSQIKSAIRNDIVLRKQLPSNKDKVLEAAPGLVTAAHEIFRRQFKWEPGEYEITLNIGAEPASAGICRKFRITVFESDTAQLKDCTERYKYGAGIYFQDSSQDPVFMPTTPT
jgi:hypothetical protein